MKYNYKITFVDPDDPSFSMTKKSKTKRELKRWLRSINRETLIPNIEEIYHPKTSKYPAKNCEHYQEPYYCFLWECNCITICKDYKKRKKSHDERS